MESSKWASVLRRIDQGQSLRQVARDYGVSYEGVRRAVRAAHELQAE
jgi:molybdenum-dependent DNA-binding transcriptional regulator ModE